MSEISLTLVVTAVTIQFERLARSFARRATVFAIRLRRTRADRILAFLFVSHDSLQKTCLAKRAELNTLGDLMSITDDVKIPGELCSGNG
jgi:hypothetical protein